MKAQVKTKINHKGNEYVKKLMKEALVETADALKSDLEQSQTMPFDTGALQNRSTFVDDSKKNKGIVTIVSDGPYARYQYFGVSRFGSNPPLMYDRSKNRNADCFWFEPYISGNKKQWATKTFAKIMKGKLK